MVRVAKEAVCEGEDGIRVEGAADSDVTLDLGRLRAVFRASADLELILALQVLGRHAVGNRSRGSGEETGLARRRAGHHLAPLGETDDEVIDVEALVFVVLAAGRAAALTGHTIDLIDQITVGIARGGVERAGGTEIDPQPQVGVARPLAEIDAGLPPDAVAVERLHVLVVVQGGVGRGGIDVGPFSVGRRRLL